MWQKVSLNQDKVLILDTPRTAEPHNQLKMLLNLLF